MTNFDIIIIVCLGISVAYSVIKGMTREIFSLLSIFGGCMAGNFFYKDLSSVLTKFTSNQTILSLATFFIIFTSVTLCINIIGRWVKKFLTSSATLSFMDRLGGAFIGLIKGVLIFSLILIPLNIFPSIRDTILQQSKIAPYIISSSKLLSQLSYENLNINNESTKKIFDNLQGSLKKIKGLKKINFQNLIKKVTSAAPPYPVAHISKKDKQKFNKIIDNTTNK